ncbi:uncharacterized protein [Excalfactoria chinensis]|uniref:uncharacterized protein isoform X3 n=1 Tax=Excalfactoria chinensis TaxID=46218 RepID=UPI003B3AA248
MCLERCREMKHWAESELQHEMVPALHLPLLLPAPSVPELTVVDHSAPREVGMAVPWSSPEYHLPAFSIPIPQLNLLGRARTCTCAP